MASRLPAAAAAAAQSAPAPPQATAACPSDPSEGGYCGDGGPVGSAKLSAPRDVSSLGALTLIADGQNSAMLLDDFTLTGGRHFVRVEAYDDNGILAYADSEAIEGV